MLSKLKKIIKKKGLLYVALGLGYSSDGAVRVWIKQNRLPSLAGQKVMAFLEKEAALESAI